ncbi:ATP-binding cassette domain-containing protein [Herbiconiux sp. P15]|uniref:ATP-binding cassette domain-containing protein n=1 Tax=Herbiconiux liukaitaii TaxID=3342799 RepID=UPI0035B9B7C1
MRGITKDFNGVKALDDVSIDLRPHEVLAICGENGAGKSTLMKVLSGVYGHGSYTGDILLEGEVIEMAGIAQSERHGIVIIHQELALTDTMSIAENIYLGNEVRGRFGLIDWDETRRRAAELLAMVGLRENPSTPVSELGVGKQQLVEIAKAFSKDVRILILDEPTSALTEEESEHLLGLVADLKERGIASIIISHKLNEIERIADRVTVIRDGTVVETLPRDEITQPRIIRGMVGRDINHLFPERIAKAVGDEVFRIDSWTVQDASDPDRVRVRDANLVARAGEIVGICGLMGAGRTELALSVFGRSYGSGFSGHVLIDGERRDVSTVSKAIKAGIAYVTEDRKNLGLHLDDDIVQNVALPSLPRMKKRGFVDEDAEIAAATSYKESMRIKTPSIFVPVGQLSGGNQQKVVLSRWIFTDPRVLILDEPTRGIDVGAKFEIYTIIQQLAASGKAVVFISSELPELLGVCDRIVAMHEGEITGELPIEQATPEKLMELMTLERTPDVDR